MMEYLTGFVVGVIVMGLAALWRDYNKKSQRIIEQEKDYALLRQHVDKCVSIIERIIYRGK